MSFGAFAGGLAQGINNGMKVGKAFKDKKGEDALAGVVEKGTAEGTAKHAIDANSLVTDTASVPKSDSDSHFSIERQHEMSRQAAAASPAVEVPQGAEVMQSGATPSTAGTQSTPQVMGPPTATPATAIPQQVPAAPVQQQIPQVVSTAQPQRLQIAPVARNGFMVGNQRFATQEEALAAENQIAHYNSGVRA